MNYYSYFPMGEESSEVDYNFNQNNYYLESESDSKFEKV